jgi:putative ABC transport system permease protein
MRDFYANRPGYYSRFGLQPLTQIHLESHLDGEIKANGSRTVINVLATAAFFLVVVALINYSNLFTSRSLGRVKEIGVRKVVGSTWYQISSQLYIESFLLISLAALAALLTNALVSPQLNLFFGAHFTPTLWLSKEYWLAILIFIIVATLGTIAYPALLVARTKTKDGLRSSTLGTSNSWAQMSLVGFQYTVSLLLIIGTYVMVEQLTYMKIQPLGFDLQQKLVIKTLPAPGEESDSMFISRISTIKSTLNSLPFVKGSTITSSLPGRKNEWRGRTRLAGDDQEPIMASLTRVDADFIPTFGLNMMCGRNYLADQNDQASVIINSEAARRLGFNNPVEALGKKIMLFREREIVGVVDSYHESGMREPLSPALFISGEGYTKFLTISFNAPIQKNHVEVVQSLWKSQFPDKPFEYFMLKDYFNRQYHQDEVVGKTMALFTGVALTIACLGLFSLSLYIIHRKKKEIGIRKVFGASVTHVACLLTGRSASALIIAVAIGLPVGYQLSQWWLQQYTYRMETSWTHLGIPALVLLTTAILTTLIQTVSAAHQNPIETIRYE